MTYRRNLGGVGRIGDSQRALCAGYVPVGAIAELGTSPYQIKGDPTVALIAQLNRFAKRTVSPGGGYGNRNYLPAGELPLASSLDDKAATTAVLIVNDRYGCVAVDVFSKQKAAWALSGLANAVPFVTANLAELTTTIAQFGDSLGLSPATVGITNRDPKFTPKFPVTTVAIVGALALAAIIVSRRK